VGGRQFFRRNGPLEVERQQGKAPVCWEVEEEVVQKRAFVVSMWTLAVLHSEVVVEGGVCHALSGGLAVRAGALVSQGCSRKLLQRKA
jgi:hypothetical protein